MLIMLITTNHRSSVNYGGVTFTVLELCAFIYGKNAEFVMIIYLQIGAPVSHGHILVYCFITTFNAPFMGMMFFVLCVLLSVRLSCFRFKYLVNVVFNKVEVQSI